MSNKIKIFEESISITDNSRANSIEIFNDSNIGFIKIFDIGPKGDKGDRGPAGISAAPAGPNQSVQFNDAGSTSGSSDFLFDKTLKVLKLSGATSINAITASGNIDNYLQLNIQNKNTATTASSDIVATNDTGTEIGNYIDMGINGSGYNQPQFLGRANDGYLYTTGSKLIIGNVTPAIHPSSSIDFVVGGPQNVRMKVSSSGEVSASSFIGNGSGLTGISTSSYSQTSSFNNSIFSRAGTFADVTNGITTTGSYTVWRVPYTCQVQAIYGKAIGSTSCQVNARKSGSAGYSLHTASNLTLPIAGNWYIANSVQNTNYAIGDTLEFIVSGSTGATAISVQVDFIRI